MYFFEVYAIEVYILNYTYSFLYGPWFSNMCNIYFTTAVRKSICPVSQALPFLLADLEGPSRPSSNLHDSAVFFLSSI